ncbi:MULTISPECIES: HAD family hydrolase [unclassified Streptococcus]|uniref:HAD family hydrolase n=1 Tax=unclassified Streptococcus TaxID=2608887 RepID=UPI000A9D0D4E|nr:MULTISPECIES: HAD family hydrolase [unclassified Streptococcus]
MKATIFDLDDTLYDQMQPLVRSIAAYGLTETQLRQLYLDFRTFADEVFEAAVTGEISLEASHIYRMKSAFAKNGMTISDDKALDLQQQYAYFQGHLELPADFVAIFEFCYQHGIKLGIITNGPHRHQERKIQALGLDKWISPEHIIISGQVGVTKPSVEIFRMMEERLNLPASELVYVGGFL